MRTKKSNVASETNQQQRVWLLRARCQSCAPEVCGSEVLLFLGQMSARLHFALLVTWRSAAAASRWAGSPPPEQSLVDFARRSLAE